ncbi:MAG: flagellar motor protein MotB [Desulfobacteraceae bacterium]|nr:flagellar motor protein MotB [Desulfobacteraceae bacterium]
MLAKNNKLVSGKRNNVDNFANGWQVVYTGFVLIMLTFFVLLTSFATMTPSKITRFVGSFSKAVNVLQHGKSIESGHGIKDVEVSIVPRENLIADLFEQVRNVSADVHLDMAELRPTAQGVEMTLKDTLLFDSGQANFTAGAYPRLEKIAQLIRRLDVPVEIEGHTDDRPIHNRYFSSNWELSTTRAVAVLRYFIEKEKINPQHLSAAGFSQFRPLVSGESLGDWALNRRVSFVFNVDRQ